MQVTSSIARLAEAHAVQQEMIQSQPHVDPATIMPDACPITVDSGASNPATLPDLPSALLRVAMHDLKQCEADPKFQIVMSQWVTPVKSAPVVDDLGFEARPGKVKGCQVCLGGAALIRTGGYDFHNGAAYSPGAREVPADVSKKVRALNDLRTGAVIDALNILNYRNDSVREVGYVMEQRFMAGHSDFDSPRSMHMPPYYHPQTDPVQNTHFYRCLEKVASFLEEQGL